MTRPRPVVLSEREASAILSDAESAHISMERTLAQVLGEKRGAEAWASWIAAYHARKDPMLAYEAFHLWLAACIVVRRRGR